MLRAGDTLGEYEIVARLRSGGMATLYLARRRGAAGFAKPVAIKVIHPHLADDAAFTKMFVDEARLSAAIADPHVVHVEELAQHEGMLFLVMEYIHGISLSQLLRALGLRGRRMTPELAVQVALQICDGLHAAHEATDEQGRRLELVHRDVSPQNVLLSYGGHVKVIDFGIAKARSGGATTTGSLRGKIAYMPPEQAFGRSIDRRADVYATGIVLWEMLTLRRLFEAETELSLLEKVRAADVPRPSTIAPIPRKLDDVVMQALAADRDARPATANELRRRLVDALPGALRIDAGELAAFVATVGKDSAVAALPQAVVEALGETGTVDEEIVKTLTIDAGGTRTLAFDASPPSAEALPSREQERVSPAAAPTKGKWIVPVLGAAIIVAAASAVAVGAWRTKPTEAARPSASLPSTVAEPAASATTSSPPTAALPTTAPSASSSSASAPAGGRATRGGRPARAANSARPTATAPPIATFGETPIAPKAPF